MGTNQPPQDNTPAEKELPGVLGYGAEGQGHITGARRAALWGAVRGGTEWSQPSPCRVRGWAVQGERIKTEVSHVKTDTRGLGLSGQVTVPKGTVTVSQAEIWALPLLPGAC